MDEQRSVQEELIKLLESDLSDADLSDALSDYHEADIADVYPLISDEARKRISRVLSPEVLSDVFSYIENAEDYIENMDVEHAADIIEGMDADDAVDLLEELEEETRTEIIKRMDNEAVEDINLIASYDDDTVGSKMTTNFILVSNDMSIKQAMKTMVEQAAENDNVSTIYCEDENGEYCGAIDLRDLIVARADSSLADLIVTSYPCVNATDKIEDIIERLKDYGEDSIPVLGAKREVLGIITSTDLVEAVDDQLGDDYAKLAGLTAEEDLREPLHRSIRKRIPWLIVLFGLGLVVSTVIGQFQHVIAVLPIIVSFQSLVLDMAGNGGTQSLAVTIRVISDGKLTKKQSARLIFKEMRVGITNGLVLGSASCGLVGLFLFLTKQSVETAAVMGVSPAAAAFMVSACIGGALAIAMTLSSLFGTLIPMFFKKIKLDPAVASGPLITTINDLIAVVTYYGLAWLLILQLLA